MGQRDEGLKPVAQVLAVCHQQLLDTEKDVGNLHYLLQTMAKKSREIHKLMSTMDLNPKPFQVLLNHEPCIYL